MTCQVHQEPGRRAGRAGSISPPISTFLEDSIASRVAILRDPAQMLDYYYSYGKLYSIMVWQNLKGLGLRLNGKWAWTGLQVILDAWWFDTGSCKDYINAGFREQAD